MIHYEIGDYEIAIREFTESVIITKSMVGNGTEEESESLLCMGNCYQKLGNYSKSLTLLQESYTIKRTRASAANTGPNVASEVDNDVSISKILVSIGMLCSSNNLSYSTILKCKIFFCR